MEVFKLRAKAPAAEIGVKSEHYAKRASLTQACCAREICGLHIPCATHKSYAAAQAAGRKLGKTLIQVSSILLI